MNAVLCCATLGGARMQMGHEPGYLERAPADILADKWSDRHQIDR